MSSSSTNGDVVAKMNYYYDDGRRPWLYARPRSRTDSHSQDYGGSPELLDVNIRDGRQHNLLLDVNGFQLVPQNTSLSNADFCNNKRKIETVYYQEIEQLIMQTTGAAKVVCFHHQVRNGKKGMGINSKSDKQYATDIHTDTSSSSAERQFFECLDTIPNSKDFESGRFLYINAWRSIDDNYPIQDNNLAMCDETSLVKPDDYILYDYFEPGYAGAHYYLSSRFSHRHRWYYYPQMTKNEVILFKQYDSDPELSGRMCFHTSFSTGRNPSNIARQSIEVRCMVFFPYHKPNTCPTRDGPARVAVGQLFLAVQYANEWPRMARWWFKDLVTKGNFQELLDELLKDKDNDLGLKNASQALKADVSRRAMAQGFIKIAKTAAEGLK